MTLREYEQHKFAVAELLRATSKLISTDQTEWRDRIRGLFQRLADDRFNLVVVGRFNRGKTSLMNAILGTDRLPTDVVPLTSVITTVGYGTKERVVLRYDERILTKEIPIEALPEFITEQGNPGNVQRIRLAEVQIPAGILRRGFYFVDTPGLGSVILENTLTTQAFLPEADAFLLVTSYDSPLSAEEIHFFKATSTWGRRIFIVLNKQDTVSKKSDQERIFRFVSQQLPAFFHDVPPKLFSISALQGLQAKLSHDDSLLEASGLLAFEQDLTDFLLTEKSNHFLKAMANRLHELLREFTTSPEVDGLINETEEFLSKLHSNANDCPEAVQADSTNTFSTLHQAGVCEICASVREQIWGFLCKCQYDLVASKEAQQNFARRGGFCPFHTWEYEAIASPYGTCNGYPTLLDSLAAALRAAASTEVDQDRLLKTIQELQPSSADCSLCDVRDKAEKSAIDLLAKQLTKDARSPNSLSALCFPHLLMLAAEVRNAATTRTLMERQAQLFQRIAEDMRRNILKHDAARQHMTTEEEDLAAQRALLALTGRRNVNFNCQSTLSNVMKSTVCDALWLGLT